MGADEPCYFRNLVTGGNQPATLLNCDDDGDDGDEDGEDDADGEDDHDDEDGEDDHDDGYVWLNEETQAIFWEAAQLCLLYEKMKSGVEVDKGYKG